MLQNISYQPKFWWFNLWPEGSQVKSPNCKSQRNSTQCQQQIWVIVIWAPKWTKMLFFHIRALNGCGWPQLKMLGGLGCSYS